MQALTNLADVALAAGEFEQAIAYSARAGGLADGQDAEVVTAITAFNTATKIRQAIRGGRLAEYRAVSLARWGGTP